jgi:hypothetical protein
MIYGDRRSGHRSCGQPAPRWQARTFGPSRYSGHTGRWLASSSFGGQDRHPVDGSRDLTARLDPVEVIEAEVIDLDPDIIRMERSALKRQLNWKCGTAVVSAVVDAAQKSG